MMYLKQIILNIIIQIPIIKDGTNAPMDVNIALNTVLVFMIQNATI